MGEPTVWVGLDGEVLEAVALVPTALDADELLPLAERLRSRVRSFTTTGGAMPGAARPRHPVPSHGTRPTAHDCSHRTGRSRHLGGRSSKKAICGGALTRIGTTLNPRPQLTNSAFPSAPWPAGAHPSATTSSSSVRPR